MLNNFYFSKKHIYFCFPLLFASFRLLENVRLSEGLLLLYFLLLFFIALHKYKISKDLIIIGFISKVVLLSAFFRSGFEDVMFTGRFLSAILLFYFISRWIQRRKIKFSSQMIYAYSIVLFILGIYSYRWEYAIIFAALFSVSILRKEFGWSIIFLILVLVINQRTGLVAILAVEMVKLFTRLSLKQVYAFLFVGLMSYFFFSLFNLEEYRIFKLLISLNLSDLLVAWNKAVSLAGSYTYDEFVHEQRSTLTQSGELSNHLRIRKWASAYVSSDGKSFLIGLGGGFFGKGADSGFVRLVFEQGIVITFFIFLGVSIFIARSSVSQRYIILSFLISNLFMDVMQSVYLMSFLGLLVNMNTVRSKTEKCSPYWR